MADTKISAFTSATTVSAVDIVPILQNSANKIATLGQIKTLVKTPLVSVISATAIPVTSDYIEVSGACTLGVGLTNGAELKIVSSGAGSITTTDNILPNNGFTFITAGTSLHIIWSASMAKWNILSVYNMVSNP